MAEQIISTITLDLQHRNIANVNLKQYDTELRVVYIRIANLGAPVDLTEYSDGYIQYQLPNGQFIVNTLELDPDDNSQYILTISRAMVNMAGVCKADVTITDGSGEMSTMTFFVNVDESVVTSEEYADIPEFQALVAYRNDAQQAADGALISEENAAASEESASDSASAAETSATNAAQSETNAANSATSASASATSASASETNAYTYSQNALTAKDTAVASATAAATSETNAAESANTATGQASRATTASTQAVASAASAKSWAVGPSAVVPTEGTDTNNAKYWSDQAQSALSGLQDDVDDLEAAVPFKFGIDAQGNYGYYKEGESQITPFKAGAEGVLPVNPSSTTGMNIWIVTDLSDTSDTAEIVY